MKPRIGIIPGDPSGIGPELIAKLLSDESVTDQADILLIGYAHLFVMGQPQADSSFSLTPCSETYTPVALKESVFGSFLQKRIQPVLLLKKKPCLPQVTTRYIGTPLFTTSRMMYNTCKPWQEVG